MDRIWKTFYQWTYDRLNFFPNLYAGCTYLLTANTYASYMSVKHDRLETMK